MDSIVTIHKVLVELLLGVIVVNILVSILYRNSLANLIKFTRIGFFLFWGAWAMAIFAGVITYVFMGANNSMAIFIMILTSILLPIIDGYRAIKLTKLWQEKKNGVTISITLLTIELIIIALTTIFAIIY